MKTVKTPKQIIKDFSKGKYTVPANKKSKKHEIKRQELNNKLIQDIITTFSNQDIITTFSNSSSLSRSQVDMVLTFVSDEVSKDISSLVNPDELFAEIIEVVGMVVEFISDNGVENAITSVERFLKMLKGMENVNKTTLLIEG